MYEISVNNLNFSYGNQKVLENIDLTIDAGEFVCLLGPSGCGKSTLLRLLAGLNRPDSGEITINGDKITGPGFDRGVVFQEYSLFPWLTAEQNISLALKQVFPEKPIREIREIAADYINLVGLRDSIHKLPKELSGGMRQRAAIAQVFSLNPPVLLMDEPFGALDAITRAHLQDLILNLWGQKQETRKTVIFVTHDVDEALLLADRICLFSLNPGRIKMVVPVDLKRPRTRRNIHTDQRFHELRDNVLNLLNESIFQELNSEDIVTSSGDRI